MPGSPDSKNGHAQVWVKVNAPVDRGLEPLISALSAFPSLQTLESCEGDADRPAWVCFYYGSYWEQQWRGLADFTLGFLGPALIREVGDSAAVSIRVDACGIPRGELSVRPGMISAVTSALASLYHSWACSDGRSDTEPSDCSKHKPHQP